MSLLKSARWRAGALTVPLVTFLADVVPLNFAGTPYRDLLDMTLRLGADALDRQIIDELISQHQRDGRFNTPIRVEDGVLTNGCHRLAALIAVGAKEVDVWVVHGGVSEPRPYGDAVTEVVFHITPAPDSGEGGPDDLDIDALWVIRSVPVPGGWLETDGASSQHLDGRILVTYEYYAPEELVRGAVPLLLERLAASGIIAKVASISSVEV